MEQYIQDKWNSEQSKLTAAPMVDVASYFGALQQRHSELCSSCHDTSDSNEPSNDILVSVLAPTNITLTALEIFANPRL